MHTRQTSPGRHLALCCLLLLNVTACSWISGDDSSAQPLPTPEAPPQLTVQQAQENLRRAESELEKARQQIKDKDIEQAQAAAKKARVAANEVERTANDFRAEAIKSGKNPDDPREAPKTYKAAQDAKEAEARADDAERKLAELSAPIAQAKTRVELAQQSLVEAQERERVTSVQRANSSATPPEERAFKPYLAIVVGVALVGAIFLLAVYQMNKMLRERSAKLISQGANIKPHGGNVAQRNGRESDLEEFRRWLKQTDERVREALGISHHVQQRIAQFEVRLKKLEDHIENITQSSVGTPLATPAPQQASQQVAAVRAGSTIHQREVVTREVNLTFPITVSDCLASLRESHAKMLTLKAASLRDGLLVKAERGEFLLIEDDRPAHPLLVIPSLERFATKQDFYSNYDDFYHCAKVTSGEVWIVSPAVVEEVSEGWRLRLKGELKV